MLQSSYYDRAKKALAMQLNVIWSEQNNNKQSKMSDTAIIYWGLKMGLITEKEKNDVMGFKENSLP